MVSLSLSSPFQVCVCVFATALRHPVSVPQLPVREREREGGVYKSGRWEWGLTAKCLLFKRKGLYPPSLSLFHSFPLSASADTVAGWSTFSQSRDTEWNDRTVISPETLQDASY